MRHAIKFILLTVWIVFISLTAQIFNSPDTILQSDLVDACVTEAKKEKNIDPKLYTHTYIHSTGGYYEVLLTTSIDQNYKMVMCNLNRNGEINFIH